MKYNIKIQTAGLAFEQYSARGHTEVQDNTRKYVIKKYDYS